MSYAHDPLWATKQYMDPFERQAYEAQVVADRSAAERNRKIADGAAIAAGVVGTFQLIDWIQDRAARKQAKARSKFISNNCPAEYSARKATFESEMQRISSFYEAEVEHVSGRIEDLQRKARYGTQKSVKATHAHIEALGERLKGLQLAYNTERDSLLLSYFDIVEYEAGLASV